MSSLARGAVRRATAPLHRDHRGVERCSLIFLGPNRSSGSDSYEQAIAEHGGSVANSIAMGGDAAAFVGVAVLPALFVTALISQRRATKPSDERFGQIAVCVLVILASAVLALMLTSGDLSAPDS